MVYFGATDRIRGFDPVTSADVPSAHAIYKVFEGLYEYEYLTRPYTVRPNLAAAMPEVSPDGLTYTFRLKQGVLFANDPCFPGGKGRELTAEDFVYSWKRVADVKTKSNCFWIFEDRIAGINDYHAASMKRQVSYDEPVAGLVAGDLLAPELRVRLRLRGVDRTPVPKTTVYNHSVFAAGENEVGFAKNRRFPTPAGDAMRLEYSHQL